MRNKRWHIILPIMLGVGSYLLYYLAHVNQDFILIPSGYDRGPLDGINIEEIAKYWRGRAFRVGVVTFLASTFVSLLLFWRGKQQRKNGGGKH